MGHKICGRRCLIDFNNNLIYLISSVLTNCIYTFYCLFATILIYVNLETGIPLPFMRHIHSTHTHIWYMNLSFSTQFAPLTFFKATANMKWKWINWNWITTWPGDVWYGLSYVLGNDILLAEAHRCNHHRQYWPQLWFHYMINSSFLATAHTKRFVPSLAQIRKHDDRIVYCSRCGTKLLPALLTIDLVHCTFNEHISSPKKCLLSQLSRTISFWPIAVPFESRYDFQFTVSTQNWLKTNWRRSDVNLYP